MLKSKQFMSCLISIAAALSVQARAQVPSELKAFACNLNQAVHLEEGRFASLSLEGQTLRVSTFNGDNFGMIGRRCDSGPVEIKITDFQQGFDLADEERTLVIRVVPLVGVNSKIGAAQISGRFKDQVSGKFCVVSGSFTCH